MVLIGPLVLSQTAAYILALGCGLVLVEYLYTYLLLRTYRRALPLPRHPVALLAIAVRGLGRNGGVLLLVVGATLITRYLWPGRIGPLHYPQYPHEAGWRLDWGANWDWSWGLYNKPWYVLLGILPSWREPLPALWGMLPLVLGGALLYWRLRPPTWLAPELRSRTGLLAGLVLAGAVPMVLFHMPGVGDLLPSLHGLGHFLDPWWFFAYAALLGPWAVFAWSALWQVAAVKRWSLAESVRDVLRHGLSVMLILFVVGIVDLLGRSPLLPWTRGIWHLAFASLFVLPWVLIAEGRGLAWTWDEVRRLWREHTADLAAFVPRAGAVFLLLDLGIDWFLGSREHLTSRQATVAWVVRGVLQLLWVLAGAVFYAEFRRIHPPAGEESLTVDKALVSD